MLIDWFTVIAQAINFITLIWLMKIFLYKPILNAIDARESRIAAELADAYEKRQQADKDREAFRQKAAEFDQQRAKLLQQATEEAQIERQRLLAEAQKAALTLQNKLNTARISDDHKLNEMLSRRTQHEVFCIARKILADLASADLEEQICNILMHRLRMMDDRTKSVIVAALEGNSDPVLVRSAFTLEPKQCSAIQETLNEILQNNVPVRFDTAADIICGIEVTTNGHKLSWSIRDYLGTIEAAVKEILESNKTALEEHRDSEIASI